MLKSLIGQYLKVIAKDADHLLFMNRKIPTSWKWKSLWRIFLRLFTFTSLRQQGECFLSKEISESLFSYQFALPIHSGEETGSQRQSLCILFTYRLLSKTWMELPFLNIFFEGV